jgi:hypothetical protein
MLLQRALFKMRDLSVFMDHLWVETIQLNRTINMVPIKILEWVVAAITLAMIIVETHTEP